MDVTIGALITPENGDIPRMRDAWVDAEAIGADRLYVSDHFFVPRPADYHAQRRVVDGLSIEQEPETSDPDHGEEPKNFEAATLQAAMCATTSRAEISCLVHCNAYRNPNLLADMARTMDHLSNGRFVLGIGSGFHVRDFVEYGYELGTYGSRLRDLDRDLDVIKSRWQKLVPPPTRKIPILMAGGGEKLALKIVAKHADAWHYFGSLDNLRHKSAVLDTWCEEIGRDPKQICRAVELTPDLGAGPDEAVEASFTHLIARATGPEWDLGLLRELLSWRDSRARAQVGQP